MLEASSLRQGDLTITSKKSIMQSLQWKNLSVATSVIRPSDASPNGKAPSPRPSIKSPRFELRQKNFSLVSNSRKKKKNNRGKSRPVQSAAQNSAAAYFTNVDSKRKLILLLVSNELDRISAWHNPQNVKVLCASQVFESSSFFLLAKAKQLPVGDFTASHILGKDSIESYVEVAWDTSPGFWVFIVLG